jgi:hypothetical protein
MPMIMNRGRLSKTDTAMRYLEQYGSGYWRVGRHHCISKLGAAK